MCGITGVYLTSDEPIDLTMIGRMANSLAHRGPDDSGVWAAGSIGLGHRRLSIIDLTDKGHQPMMSCDSSAVVAFNGEIYNFYELRQELESYGVEFRSKSDTEVIVEGYCKWGEGVLQRLNGMFAVAIVDVMRRRLLLARDRFGIKPLHYALTRKGLVFGSEIKAILVSGLVEKRIDDSAVAEYLHYSSALGSRTFFESVKQVAPGQALIYEQGCAGFLHFADVIPEVESVHDYETVVETVRRLLEDSVKRQMVADVPIGVFLSGGVDSSAIATFASRHTKQPLQTYSADFAFAEDESELELARLVAQKIGSRHEELRIEPTDFTNLLKRLVDAHDQPFGDAANIPIFLMCRALNGSPKVVLQGDGGDELFGGYPRYGRLARQRLFQLIAIGAMPLRGLVSKSSKAYRALRSLNAMTFAQPDLRMAMLMSQEPLGDDPLDLLSEDYRTHVAAKDPFSRYREMHQRFCELDPVQAMLYTDMSVILPDVYFEKVDRSSMVNSIEVRVPMMDNELAAYALSLPSRLKLKGGKKKYVLKSALRGIVPDRVLDGKKRGFGVPVSRWLRGPLSTFLRDVLTDETVCRSGLFNGRELLRRINQHLEGSADYGQSLYKMLNLAIWYCRIIA